MLRAHIRMLHHHAERSKNVEHIIKPGFEETWFIRMANSAIFLDCWRLSEPFQHFFKKNFICGMIPVWAVRRYLCSKTILPKYEGGLGGGHGGDDIDGCRRRQPYSGAAVWIGLFILYLFASRVQIWLSPLMGNRFCSSSGSPLLAMWSMACNSRFICFNFKRDKRWPIHVLNFICV